MIRAKAFTLVEILIVVVIIGILAAIVIPAIASSATSARDAALASDVQLMRRFILIYKAQHLETSPGYLNSSLSATNFSDQATLPTDEEGRTEAHGGTDCKRGPYMSKVPANPVNGLDTVQMLADGDAFPANGDDSHGWIYKAATGEIRPDSGRHDVTGRSYYDY